MIGAVTHALIGLLPLDAAQPDPPPSNDNVVVAGSVAAVVFIALLVALVVICRSLVTRLKNVDRAAEEGLYDPSDPKPDRQRRGLGAQRPPVQ